MYGRNTSLEVYRASSLLGEMSLRQISAPALFRYDTRTDMAGWLDWILMN